MFKAEAKQHLQTDKSQGRMMFHRMNLHEKNTMQPDHGSKTDSEELYMQQGILIGYHVNCPKSQPREVGFLQR